MKRIRLFFAVLTARIITFIIRVLGRGRGSSLPGRIALRIYPDLIGDCASKIRRGLIMVTGTNGKTTTNNMIAAILEGSGFTVLINREGANLVSGVASAFVRGMDLSGGLSYEFACLEVDEAVFPILAKDLKPSLVIVTNFFRDQLDRYGELDKTVSLVGGALKEMKDARLVLNADDPLVAQMGKKSGLRHIFFGVDRHDGTQSRGAAAREAKFCPFCGCELTYSYYQYSQLGGYACAGCGFARPDPDVEAVSIQSKGSRITCLARFRQGITIPLTIPIHGLYNLYNVLAAYTAALLLDIDAQRAAALLAGFRPATGRMERFIYQGKPVYLNLVKNPAGFNEALGVLVDMAADDTDVLIAINDNDADGRDISWLWDVDFEVLAGCRDKFKELICSGLRAEEMALRLKYGGVDEARLSVVGSYGEAVKRVLEGKGKLSYILATYTALWPVERILSSHAERDQAETEYLPHVS